MAFNDDDETRSQSLSIVSDEASEDEIEGTYVVREILDFCKKDGGRYYLVAWNGWDNPEDNTWEPEVNLWGARDAIKNFWKKKGVISKSPERKDEPEILNDTEEYQVQKIITHRTYRELRKHGITCGGNYKPDTILYRVRWVGYLPEDDTWEPDTYLYNVQAFLEYKKLKRSKSPSTDRGKKRDGSPLGKISKKYKDDRDEKSLKNLFAPPSKDELRKLKSLQEKGVDKKSQPMNEGGMVFEHVLSNINGQKKALMKKKALEKQRRREEELKAMKQDKSVDPSELFKQYEDEARRQMNELLPRWKKVLPDEIVAFKEKFKKILEEQKAELKKKRQARRLIIMTRRAAQTLEPNVSEDIKANNETTQPVVNEPLASISQTVELSAKQTKANLKLINRLAFLTEIVKNCEQAKISNSSESKNAVIYENLLICKNINDTKDLYNQKRCKKNIGDFMADQKKNCLNKVS